MAKTQETNNPASSSRCTPFNLLCVGDSEDNIINHIIAIVVIYSKITNYGGELNALMNILSPFLPFNA